MYVDPINRQTYYYATPIPCDNIPRNQDFCILGPEPIKQKAPLLFTPTQDTGLYSNAELDQFWNRILLSNILIQHFNCSERLLRIHFFF